MRFDYATAGRILFGTGVTQEILHIAPEIGRKALVVTGAGRLDPGDLFDLLRRAGVETVKFTVAHEPDVNLVQQATELARGEKCDFVIGFGGGSALDAGKVAAAMLSNPGELLDYLEVVGRGNSLRNPSAPYIAIPTTAGTGTEATRNAVVAVPDARVKVSMRSSFLLPRVALVDPEWTVSLPPEVTANTGMDALTQVLEPFVSTRANAMADMSCRAGLEQAGKWLGEAFLNGRNSEARSGMSFASLMGGISLANAGLGAVHGFAGPIGGMFDAPHGAVCACLLPIITKVNIAALKKREPDSPALERYAAAARLLTGSSAAQIEDGMNWLFQIRAELRIANLSAYGITKSDIPGLVEKAQNASSMKTNPVKLLPEEMTAILLEAL